MCIKYYNTGNNGNKIIGIVGCNIGIVSCMQGVHQSEESKCSHEIAHHQAKLSN